MFNHAPPDYFCPFCVIARGEKDSRCNTCQSDVVFCGDSVIAFVASHWWEKNKGHVLVIPREHIENIYDLPRDLAGEIQETARRVAIAMKRAYQCEGVSTRQHNEPAGYQEVWHYHLHVFPRYANDRLYPADGDKRATTPEERLPYATKLRDVIDL